LFPNETTRGFCYRHVAFARGPRGDDTVLLADWVRLVADVGHAVVDGHDAARRAEIAADAVVEASLDFAFGWKAILPFVECNVTWLGPLQSRVKAAGDGLGQDGGHGVAKLNPLA
jgi:hypothetical protein